MKYKDDLAIIGWKLSFLKQDIIKNSADKKSIIRKIEDIQNELNQIYILMKN